MTILSKNLQRLFKENEFSKACVARQCDSSPASVHQWLTGKSPIVPKPSRLLTLACLLDTTIEELMTNPRCKSGEIVTPKLNILFLEKTLKILASSKTIAYAYDHASHRKQAYMFRLIYSLCEDLGAEEITEDDLLGRSADTLLPIIGVAADKKNDKKSKKTSTNKRTTKRR